MSVEGAHIIHLADAGYLACPFSELTANELMSYMVGFYEGHFSGREPVYPNGKAQFLFEVLTDGYGLVQAKSLTDLEVRSVDPTSVKAAATLDHDTFHDPLAWKLMNAVFISTLRN